MSAALLLLLYIVTVLCQMYTYPCPLSLGSQRELQALVDLYQSTGGFTWAVNEYWSSSGMSTQDPCCWLGVTCALQNDGTVHVTEINLAYNNLQGTIPNSISTFAPYLTKLLLHHNMLSGTVPASIFGMQQLGLLFLDDNQLSGSLGPLTGSQLTTAYFENNMFTGGFPDITQLPVLQSIDVSNNQLTGPLPAGVGYAVLDMRGNNNQFSGEISPALLQTLTLQTFEFGNNQLDGPVPPISSHLAVVNLINNKLGCFAPTAVGTDLNITGNKFLCQPGVQTVPGCVNPSIMSLISPTAPIPLGNGGVMVNAQFTLSDVDPVRDCPGLYCFLGTQQMGPVTIDPSSGMATCVLAPTSVGAYALSVRTTSGIVVTQQTSGGSIIISVTAGCAGPNMNCNSPNGVCSMGMGCICNQAMGWQGPACDQKICPRNCFATSMQGTCDTTTGTCNCNSGWGGADCSIAEKMCPGDGTCSSHGACNMMTGQCQCYPQVAPDPSIPGRNYTYRWSGAQCEQFVCPQFTVPGQSSPVMCSGHGTCGTTSCNCAQNFIGADCSVGTLQCSIPCPANISSCDMNTGTCACQRGLTGADCSQHICPTTVPNTPCSGHGTCDPTTGDCTCTPPYDFLGNCAIARMACPMQGPNGPGNLSLPCGGPQFGECKPLTGQCACVNNARVAYSGAACDTPICPSSWQGCNPKQLSPPAGMCVGASCMCNAGYSGMTCDAINCKLGSDGSQCSVMSGKGQCDGGSGICICLTTGSISLDPKTGCSSNLCPNSNNAFDCGTHGTCNNGVCTCNKGFAGDGCQNAVPDPVPIALGVVGAIIFVCLIAVCVFFILRRAAIKKLTAEHH